MTKFRIKYDWNSYPDPSTELGETTATAGIWLDAISLTRNEDIWSKTVRDEMHVSLYPLAFWFASSWWRINYEVLPANARNIPSHDWRMSHELAASNMGFVWPNIIFAPDRESLSIWASASARKNEDAVRFLASLPHAYSISKRDFQDEVSNFIDAVIARLQEVGCKGTDLQELWELVQADLQNPMELQKRRLEAEMGFDPEDCPEELVSKAIDLQNRVGEDSFSELSGAYADVDAERVTAIAELVQAEGVSGRPDDVLDQPLPVPEGEPWEIAVSAARAVRQRLGVPNGPLKNGELNDLLGLNKSALSECAMSNRRNASIAAPKNGGCMKIIPRKTHPIGQRFELARFVGDYVQTSMRNRDSWLVSADLSTSRQKYQRAFAAEFLCPIGSLVEFLDDDFSETAIEDAAEHFAVSEKTVDAILMNNHYLPRRGADVGMPYEPSQALH